jgi:hypothetical protein
MAQAERFPHYFVRTSEYILFRGHEGRNLFQGFFPASFSFSLPSRLSPDVRIRSSICSELPRLNAPLFRRGFL